MEEKNSCLDVEFIKAYLQSSIELETQKRIAEGIIQKAGQKCRNKKVSIISILE